MERSGDVAFKGLAFVQNTLGLPIYPAFIWFSNFFNYLGIEHRDILGYGCFTATQD
jgi:hypothetical protein